MLKRSLTATVVLAAVLLCAAPARPQSPPPDTMTAARELVATMRIADQFKAIMPIILQNMKPLIARGRPEVERDYDLIVPTVSEVANSRLAEITDAIVALYARNFTAGEMREITAFFRTPTGQKLLQKYPALTQDSMALGQKFGQAIAPELQNRIVDELRKRGHSI